MRPLFALAVLTLTASASAETYSLSEKDGTIYAQVWKNRNTVAQGLSHDHVILASKWQGSVTYDPAGATTCAVSVTIAVADLHADAPELRKRVGYDTVLSDKDRATVESHFRAKDQLDAEHFPRIEFKSASCEGSGEEGIVKVKGALTIRGKAKDVTVPMKLKIADGKLHADGTITVTHKDFGFSPYSGFLGSVKNGEDIKLTIAIAQPK